MTPTPAQSILDLLEYSAAELEALPDSDLYALAERYFNVTRPPQGHKAKTLLAEASPSRGAKRKPVSTPAFNLEACLGPELYKKYLEHKPKPPA